MFEKIKNLFKKPEVKSEPEPKKVKEKKVAPAVPELTAKEKATAAGEPYINILSMELDPNDVNNGAFELDWNEKFILNLIRAGYKQKDSDTDNVLVDRWFQTVCRNIALEVYEQNIADPINRETDQLKEELRNIRRTDIGNGRSEIS
jgi:hypothetical protein